MPILSTTVCAAVLTVLTFAATAGAQTTYDITVQLDEATATDDDLFSAAALAAPIGQLAQPLRKLGAGLLLEVRLLVEQRVHDGLLTLDDGLQVALVEGTRVRALRVRACNSVACAQQTTNGAVLIPFPPIPSSGTPTYVEIWKDGVCTRRLVFPFGGGSPQLEPGCF